MTSEDNSFRLTAGWIADWRVTIEAHRVSQEVENVRESWPERPLDFICVSCDAPLAALLDSADEDLIGSDPYRQTASVGSYFEKLDFGITIVSADIDINADCDIFVNECLRRQKPVTLLAIDRLPEKFVFKFRDLQMSHLIQFRQCDGVSVYETLRRVMTAEAIVTDRRNRAPKSTEPVYRLVTDDDEEEELPGL